LGHKEALHWGNHHFITQPSSVSGISPLTETELTAISSAGFFLEADYLEKKTSWTLASVRVNQEELPMTLGLCLKPSFSK